MLCYDMTYLRLQLGAHNSQPNQVNPVVLFIVAVQFLYYIPFLWRESHSIQYYYIISIRVCNGKKWIAINIDSNFALKNIIEEEKWQSYSIESNPSKHNMHEFPLVLTFQ